MMFYLRENPVENSLRLRRKALSARWLCVFAGLSLPWCSPGNHTIACPEDLVATVSIDSFSFRVPKHLTFEKITDTNLCQWPIVATWDAEGNLVVAESAGVKQPVQEQRQTRPHRIVRLIDSDRDGRFDVRQVVAEDLAFPEGVLCLGNDIYVSAPPEIWKLTDADNDGVCESRSVWHDGKTLTGCANDLHGPFLGPEGWIYWSKSAFAEQEFDLSIALPAKSTASHLYRKAPTAISADRIMTGGMDNLVDIAFDDFGDRFFVSTFLHHPGNGLRDGIGHAVYGSVFGKDHAVLRSHVKTGPLMKPIAELGPAAPSGLLTMSQATPWIATGNPQSQTTMVAALFNLQKVTAHSLTPIGASYTASTSDLVVGEQLDFHPVDVLEDVDGSLLIVDTGGWYDLCCPSSGNEERISKGGIYRLKDRSAQKALQRTWEEVERALATNPVSLLNHPHRRVREHAMTQLHAATKKRSGDDSRAKLMAMLNDPALPVGNRTAAFWTMARTLVDSKDVDKTPDYVKQLLEQPNDPLIAAALHLTSTYRWHDTSSPLVRLLQNSSPTVQRLAAECLGRAGLASSVDPLLQAWNNHHSNASSKPDRILEHSILFALIELGVHRDSSSEVIARLSKFLTSESSLNHKHASLHVLKELQHVDKVSFVALENAAESKHQALAKLAQESIATIDAHRKQYLSQLSNRPKKSLEENAASITAVLVAGYNQPDVVEWVRANILESEIEQTWQSDLLRKMLVAYENQPLPDGWSSGLATLVRKDDPMTRWLIERIAATKISANAKELVSSIATRVDSEDFSKSAVAIAMLPKGLIPVSASKQLTLVKTMLNTNDGNHQLARRSIRKVDLEADAWEEILRSLTMFGPLEFPGMVETLVSSRVSKESERTGRLLAAIEQSPASKSLAADQLERWFAGHAEGTKKEVKLLLDRVFAPPADMKTAMDELVQKLEPGDAHRGQDIYRSSRAACSACHRIGYVGGNIGPELTKIGKSRNRRDFVEAILYPSHRIAQGFASTTILTVDDEVITGLITFEDDSRIELSTSADKKVSVDKKAIQQRNQSAVSLMPSGIDKVLTISELSDLIAFLEQSK